jgi:hypothetical protein
VQIALKKVRCAAVVTKGGPQIVRVGYPSDERRVRTEAGRRFHRAVQPGRCRHALIVLTGRIGRFKAFRFIVGQSDRKRGNRVRDRPMAFGPLRIAAASLVAITRASRLTKSLSARPRNSSLVPMEYMLAVSKKLIRASSA